MKWTTKDIGQADWDRLTAKAAKDKATVDDMLATVINRYLADVKREAGADVDTNIAKKLAEMTDAQKQSLATQIGA